MLTAENLLHEWKKSKWCRPLIRGFSPIVGDLIERLSETQDITSVLELGIGGGGSHEKWAQAGADIVGGIELFHPDVVNELIGGANMQEFWHQSYKFLHESTIPQNGQRFKEPCVYRFSHGLDVYADETPKEYHNQHGIDEWHIICDDSANGVNLQHPFVPLWKDYLSQNGIMISMNPNGYGTDEARCASWSDNVNMFREHSQHGMVIFDCMPFVKDSWQHEQYGSIASGRWMGVYTPNMDLYRDIYLKYEEHVVEGDSFLK